ncbi:MAG: serine hydrolase domain-containing protein [Ornithinimicrobium sp.]
MISVSFVAVGCSSNSGGSEEESGATSGLEYQSSSRDSGTTVSDGYREDGPPGDPGQTIDRAEIEAAIADFDPLAEEALAQSGVPGMSVSVIFEDEVVMAQGHGVRELGTPEKVTADTVFQLASVSKPVGSAVVASIVGEGLIDWDQPVTEIDPSFELADPWVTENVSFADLYAHRSGLPDHAGDLLEDLGSDREAIVKGLRNYPLSPFRATYHYTNAGLTEAGVTAAEAADSTWEAASAQRLYEPLGMTRSSSSFDDYMAADNRAVPHVRDSQGEWIVTPDQRDPQAQSPAGGASSTANDMAQFMRMQLASGMFEGEEVVDEEALLATHAPHMATGPPRSPSARSSFYGLGWNVGYDERGRTRLSHSGAFALGAATTIKMVPNEDLAVVVLTNGHPVGLDLAMTDVFIDLATGWRGESRLARAICRSHGGNDFRRPRGGLCEARSRSRSRARPLGLYR